MPDGDRMARTNAGRELTALHRQRQLVLRAATLRDMLVLSKLWNSPFDDFADATATLVESRRPISSALAADYYRGLRFAEGVPGTATPELVSETNRDKVLASLYVTGLGTYNRSVKAGLTTTAAREQALVSLSGAVGRHVLNAGRDTIIGSVKADKRGGGWARVTSGKPCSWCAMIASRGPVFSEDTADFQAHDHCMCMPQPHWQGDDGWTDQARGFRAKWDEATRNVSSEDALNAFRRSFE